MHQSVIAGWLYAARKTRGGDGVSPSEGVMVMAAAEKISIENVNRSGRDVRVDADKYWAVCNAIIDVLPSAAPGMTIASLKEAVRPPIPDALFPSGFKAGWWVMGLQLDLSAKTLIVEDSKPLRLYSA